MMDATSTWRKAKELLTTAVTEPAGELEQYLDAHSSDAQTRDAVRPMQGNSSDVRPGPPDPERTGEQPRLEPGTRIGPYVIVDELGAGGMGTVFLGSDTRLRRKVALKCLSSHAALPDLHASILREARAAARISHPNVAVVHDVVEHEGRAFLVMEYVQGESLADRLRRERLSIHTAVAIGRQLAAALVAAHASGVIHRDLKPGNIQVMPDGTVKVLDFGVARAAVTASTMTRLSTTTETAAIEGCGPQPGTPAYMAPEQLLGQAADERSDIYSLGVVLYEMLAGHRPYTASDPAAMVAALADAPPSLHQFDSAIPPALSAVVARALARDPRARFQSAAELASALEALARPPRRLLSTRWQVAVVSALAVAMVLSAGIPLMMRSRGTPPARPPVIAVMPLAGEAGGSSSIGPGITEVLTASLVGVPGIVVVPRDATATLVPTSATLPKAAKELGLEYAVTGVVQRNGDRPGIVLNVIDASRGSIVATRAFESSDATAFPLLEQAADWVAEQAEKLARSAGGRRPALPTTSMPAFEDYSQGRMFLDRVDVPGNIGRAIEAFQRALARDPQFALAHAALGNAYWAQYSQTRDPATAGRAKDETLEALRLDANQPAVRYALATVYHGTGRKREAVDELKKAIALQPSSDENHRLLGTVYSDLGDVEKAVSEQLVAIRLRPGFWGNYRALGVTYYRAGRYRDAIATFTRLTELQPDSGAAFQLLGASYHQIGDLDRALTNYERANAINPSPSAWSNIGTIHYFQGRFAEAVAAYRRAIRLRPKEPSSYRNLGDALIRVGDRPGAMAAYREAIAVADERLTIEKRDAALLAQKALCLAKIGTFRPADQAIAEARAVAVSADVLYQEAIVRTLEGRFPDALATLRLAIEKGYSRDYARGDDEFIPLRAFPEFAQIVSPR